jgi:hypothetical protein
MEHQRADGSHPKCRRSLVTADFPLAFVVLVVVLAYALGCIDRKDQYQNLQKENALLKARLAALQKEEVL